MMIEPETTYGDIGAGWSSGTLARVMNLALD